MRVYPERLAENLSGTLAPVYVLSGEEPLLVEEALDEIRRRARELGFEERQVFHVEKGFDWRSLLDAGDTLSLFASKRLLELRIPSGKPGDAGSKTLLSYCANLPEDTVLVVICGADKGMKNAKWYKTLDQAGVAVQCWPLDRERLPQWLQARLRKHSLQCEPLALEALAWRVEGNLLAAAQAIDRLALLGQGETVTPALVEEAVSDNARFDVFACSQAALLGETQRAVRMVERLRGEGVYPLAILNPLLNDLRDVAALAARDKPLGRLWPQRERWLRKAANRRDANHWQRCLPTALRVDQTVKGQRQGDAWLELVQFCLQLA